MWCLSLSIFCRYDVGHDGYLDLAELKIMMEKLGAPQTHLSLKKMISEVDEDKDGKISFREFLLIYRWVVQLAIQREKRRERLKRNFFTWCKNRKAKAGELTSESGLEQLARLTEINVDEVGVNGAKNFFEAKIEEQLRTNKFHDEIRYKMLSSMSYTSGDKRFETFAGKNRKKRNVLNRRKFSDEHNFSKKQQFLIIEFFLAVCCCVFYHENCDAIEFCF